MRLQRWLAARIFLSLAWRLWVDAAAGEDGGTRQVPH
jgi:hypothetical protein